MSQQHHYYACMGFGWNTAKTRREAVNGLIRMFRHEFKRIAANQIKDNQPGAYIWSCEVPLPADAEYKINYYKPEVEGLADSQEHYVTRVTQKEANWFTVPAGTKIT